MIKYIKIYKYLKSCVNQAPQCIKDAFSLNKSLLKQFLLKKVVIIKSNKQNTPINNELKRKFIKVENQFDQAIISFIDQNFDKIELPKAEPIVVEKEIHEESTAETPTQKQKPKR